MEDVVRFGFPDFFETWPPASGKAVDGESDYDEEGGGFGSWAEQMEFDEDEDEDWSW